MPGCRNPGLVLAVICFEMIAGTEGYKRMDIIPVSKVSDTLTAAGVMDAEALSAALTLK